MLKPVFSLFFLASLLILAACTTVPSPPPPDLDRARSAAELRLQSIQAAEATILSELEILAELHRSFQDLSLRVLTSELPLARLRLVAMNCLNTEYGDGLSQVVGLEGTPLSCRPAHLESLHQDLLQGPAAQRDLAIQYLYLIDQIRILRGGLRQRMTRLPMTIADHREFIVEERATLRQIEADLARRRSLYGASDWNTVAELLADHRRLLRDFSDQLDALAEAYPAWPASLDTLISQVYFELADLREDPTTVEMIP